MTINVVAYTAVDFEETRPGKTEPRTRKGYLGVAQDSARPGITLFGEVAHPDLVSAEGTPLATLTYRSYQVDKYFSLERIQKEGLPLDAGSASYDRVYINTEQMTLALNSLPSLVHEGQALSGASLTDPSVTRLPVGRTANIAGAIADHQGELADQLAELPPQLRVYHQLREQLVDQIGESVFSPANKDIPYGVRKIHRDTLKKVDELLEVPAHAELLQDSWIAAHPDLPRDEVDRHIELTKTFVTDDAAAHTLTYLDATLTKWDPVYPANITEEQQTEVGLAQDIVAQRQAAKAHAEMLRQNLVEALAEDRREASVVNASPEF